MVGVEAGPGPLYWCPWRGVGVGGGRHHQPPPHPWPGPGLSGHALDSAGTSPPHASPEGHNNQVN